MRGPNKGILVGNPFAPFANTFVVSVVKLIRLN